MTDQTRITLNDGHTIPAIGFGVFQIPADGSTYTAVKEALEVGYRHIDTAQAYFNEQEVGRAIADSGIAREGIFVTSKLWIQDYAYETAKATIDTTLEKMGLDYLDLYLIHQPYGEVEQAWKALEEAKAAGKIRSIGVSNFTPAFWKQFVPRFASIPAVNQVEFNPYFQQKELRELLSADNVRIEAWAPLGRGNRDLFAEPALVTLAEKYGKDTGQIILRFETQEGIIVLPKSTKKMRMASNKDIFGFTLTDAEMDELRALDKGRGAHDPDAPGVGEYLLANYDIHAND
ncbi:2,5-diketo-D-gluconic acid reductase [Alloscardovia macacae]|uniref:2,5-diketo-D-gluconic acid reductase n=1 Tax=Alloscardovia macacae TaxID=1160091 RepID=A0A1Y2SW71_9BIFI|nr:aldo/keto reductase [Alloscardovia macacae]OTA26355.1 2,5-diketo-D-gluconic acid reductase [Alloscardovia macacae]OTA28839.1 2,5-diketo-D-gluconic acid reductase [Alloscardovia macacae]